MLEGGQTGKGKGILMKLNKMLVCIFLIWQECSLLYTKGTVSQ